MAVNFWNRFFGREEIEASKSVATKRLRMVLVHDRLDMSEQVMNDLREDLISVIGKYLVIDEKALDVTLTREDEGVALVANIPILNVRHSRREEPVKQQAEILEEEAPAPAKEKKNTPSKNTAPKKPAAKKSDTEAAAEA